MIKVSFLKAVAAQAILCQSLVKQSTSDNVQNWLFVMIVCTIPSVVVGFSRATGKDREDSKERSLTFVLKKFYDF